MFQLMHTLQLMQLFGGISTDIDSPWPCFAFL
jgi:hypothetical protein